MLSLALRNILKDEGGEMNKNDLRFISPPFAGFAPQNKSGSAFLGETVLRLA